MALFKADTVSRDSILANNEFSTSFKLASHTAAAYGEMVHVFVDPNTRRPVAMDAKIREGLSKLGAGLQ